MTNKENIQVICRFRPLNSRENSLNKSNNDRIIVDTDSCLINIEKESTAERGRRESHEFVFDHLYDEKSSQEQIFNGVAKSAVNWVVEGYNSTIFAYGPTGTGKTYTMFGLTNEKRGIIPRCCETLFNSINVKKEVVEAHIKCSFLEIYREHICDLLDSSNSHKTGFIPSLRIRQNKQKGVYVQGLIEKFVYTPKDVLDTIKHGAKQRAMASTSLNNTSSRSHAVLSLVITQVLNDGTEIVSKLHLVDLAGSENVEKSEAQGDTLAEAQMINKSLSALGNVINALTDKKRTHIPYRDSRLTYLLQDSLGGNSRTILITTASPDYNAISETLNTLKFAKRAKEIKNIPKVNRNRSNAQLRETVEKLQKQLDDITCKYQEAQEIINNIENNAIIDSPTRGKLQKEDCKTVDNKYIIILQSRNKRLQKQVEDLQKHLECEKDKYVQSKEIFSKQRELAQNYAINLYEERVKVNSLRNLIEQHQMFYESLKEALKTPNVLERMVQHVEIKDNKELKINTKVPRLSVEIDSPN